MPFDKSGSYHVIKTITHKTVTPSHSVVYLFSKSVQLTLDHFQLSEQGSFVKALWKLDKTDATCKNTQRAIRDDCSLYYVYVPATPSHRNYMSCSPWQDLSDSWPDPGKLPSYVDIEVAPSDEVALANALTSEGIQFGAITDGTDGWV